MHAFVNPQIHIPLGRLFLVTVNLWSIQKHFFKTTLLDSLEQNNLIQVQIQCISIFSGLQRYQRANQNLISHKVQEVIYPLMWSFLFRLDWDKMYWVVLIVWISVSVSNFVFLLISCRVHTTSLSFSVPYRPCVYTVGSPINNRALFPCQELPVAMSTWQATVRADACFVVLMSGENVAEPAESEKGTTCCYIVIWRY